MNEKKRSTINQLENQTSKKISRGIRWWLLLLLIMLIGALGGYFVFSKEETKTTEIKTNDSQVADEPSFKKEGTLAFLKQGTMDTVRIIDIEIAETPDELSQGLMYRTSISDKIGMLFIFERSEKKQFWMKNTKVSLDIMFANENYEIVTIYKYTTPYSEASLPSYKEAKYVIEVGGGFTKRYDITEGDKFNFKKLNSSNPV